MTDTLENPEDPEDPEVPDERDERDDFQEWADQESVDESSARAATLAGSLDPKGAAGALKCPLHLIPPAAMRASAWAHKLGAQKYGAWNWRRVAVCASTYIGAAMRHVDAWRDGEDIDPESGVSHLGHAIACLNIILDAAAAGTLADDRPPAIGRRSEQSL